MRTLICQISSADSQLQATQGKTCLRIQARWRWRKLPRSERPTCCWKSGNHHVFNYSSTLMHNFCGYHICIIHSCTLIFFCCQYCYIPSVLGNILPHLTPHLHYMALNSVKYQYNDGNVNQFVLWLIFSHCFYSAKTKTYYIYSMAIFLLYSIGNIHILF